MSGALPPLEKISLENHGPYVIMTDYILMFLTVMVVLVRLAARFRIAHKISIDDFFISTALLLLIAQSICVQVASDIGLGKHRNRISREAFQSYSKLNYISQILSIGVLACAKVSVTLLIIWIKPQPILRLACFGLLGVIGAWAVSSMIALGLQCDRPRPWDFTPGRCIDQAALYYIIGVVNILTDLVMVVIAVLMMIKVQVSRRNRWLVVSLFAVRLLVVVAAIIQLAQLPAYFRSTDQTWKNVNPSIWTSVTLNLSLITACVPPLKRLISDLQTGLTRVAIPEQFELGNYESGLRSGSKGLKSPQVTGNHSQAFRFEGGKRNSVRVKDGSKRRERDDSPGEERSESVKGLTEDAIFQTIDYRVEYHGRDGDF